ncbi:MAG: DUF6580 family putative transport protein [Bacteroidia bacterium]
MRFQNYLTYILIIIAALIAVISRLLPHMPNFALMGAVALFAGAFIRSSRFAFLIPVAAVFASDALMEIDNPGSGFYAGMGVVYTSYAIIFFAGRLLTKPFNPFQVGTGAVLASVIFFVITNLSAWLYLPIYTKDLNGLLNCYAAALPFFRTTLISDLAFSTVLFGSYYLVVRMSPSVRISR